MQHAMVTTEQAAKLLQLDPETVRRKIRSREIKAWGRPARIPVDFFVKLGISATTVDAVLGERVSS